MSSITTDSNISQSIAFIPSNRGYLEGVKKITGKAKAIENADNVKLIEEQDEKYIHAWNKDSFVITQMAHTETDHDGWTVQTKRKVIEKRKMTQCPNEVCDSGYCNVKMSADKTQAGIAHTREHYHFARIDHKTNTIFMSKDDKPLCKYSGNRQSDKKCWLLDDATHIDTFSHTR